MYNGLHQHNRALSIVVGWCQRQSVTSCHVTPVSEHVDAGMQQQLP